MLMENEHSYSEEHNKIMVPSVPDRFSVICPVCFNNEAITFAEELEDMLTSDLRNPEVEAFMCPRCRESTSLASGVPCSFYKNGWQKASLCSDGVFVYYENTQGRNRIL